MENDLTLFENRVLRSAIRKNLVSFPSQVPVFSKDGGDIQARMAQLYFVSGWTIPQLRQRYGLPGETVRKSLTEWRVRAVSSGYIQEINAQVTGSSPIPERLHEDVVEEDDNAGLQLINPRATGRESLPLQAPAVAESSSFDDVPAVLLKAVHTGVRESGPWPPFCFRLLSILRQEYLDCELPYSAALAARIASVAISDPELARDLLCDLADRVRDERESQSCWRRSGPGRITLLQTLAQEIHTSLREACHWPTHCKALLDTVSQGCKELTMKLCQRQIERIRHAVESDPSRVSNLIRELNNRLADERDHATLVCVSDRGRQRVVGGGR